jgi:peptide/nickel transport system substrate-binding protein
MTISFWVDTKPFDDPKVREALKLVVDRQAMIDTVLLGYGEAGADNPVPVGNPNSYVKEAPKQDIEKAKALLAEAGYKDGLKFDLYTAEGVPGMVRMAQVYAEQAKAAGIDINVIVTPAESFWDDVWLKQSAVTSAWSMRPPGEGLAVAYVQTAKWKETHWERPDYDALLNKANTTVDDAERQKLFQQTGELLAKEGGLVLPMFVHQVLALRKGCEGYTPRAQNFNLNFEDLSCSK